MQRCNYLLMTTVLLGVMFFGCEPADEFVPENEVNLEAVITGEETIYDDLPAYFVEELKSFESVLISDDAYLVELTGRTIGGTDENPTTTFYYTVTGQEKRPALDSFILEIPGCAGSLLSWTPTSSASVSENSIKWNSSVPANESQDYSMTFEGEVPLGVISTIVTRGSIEEVESVLGPCQGVYTLSGSLFINSNDNTGKQTEESGISSEVTLFNKTGNKEITLSTSENGAYSFMVLNGDYEISVAKDLMGDGYYLLEGDNLFAFSDVTENSSENNFPFQANTSEMIGDLEGGTLKVNTEPTKFWVDQVRHAGKKNSNYTVEEMDSLLIKVEEKLLEQPFDFGTDKRKNALDILTKPIKTELDQYLQQLLTAELNILSGRGAFEGSEDNQLEDFNDALLIYAEAIACRAMGYCEDTDSFAINEVTIKAVSSADSNLLLSFNGSGGL